MRNQLLFSTLLLSAACGGAATVDDTGLDETGEAVNGDQLVGAWDGSGRLFTGIVFQEGARGRRTFFAEQVVICARAPCYPVRIEGSWGVSGRELTLRPTGQSNLVFDWAVSNRGSTLRLFQRRTNREVESFRGVPTFCTRTTDCSLQSYPHILCSGGPICNADQTCGWQCGAARGGGYGDTCGGIAGIACREGLECVGADAFPDATGTCRPAQSTSLCALVDCPPDRPRCVEQGTEFACLANDQCATDADCRRGQRCVPELTCIRAPCFSPLVCR